LQTAKICYPNIKIVIWTGYVYEDIKNFENLQDIFSNIDYLIDGPFKIEDRDITLKWRGSRNQRIIDMKKTLQDKEVKVIS
jgi:anaerobic ribonucleoside-triphosphate reductase activating protein